MKVDQSVWRRRAVLNFTGCLIVLLAASASGVLAAGPLGPSERPEAYFNGTSYIRLAKPFSLKQLVGLSFRTCVGGELFSQRYEGYTLHVTALYEKVVVSWARPGQQHREVDLIKETLDNHWHWVALRYKPNPPSLLLEVDKDTQVISNVTLYPELLSPSLLEAEGAVVLVGNLFSGCVHEGPQLEFHPTHVLQTTVRFGNCPLTTDDCIDRKDVLRIPPKDHCYNEPCLRHGTCISRHDRYECHCTARYSGNNCEVDAGDPCATALCAHAARCVEDVTGDYSCLCPPHYHGKYCELEESLDPQCVAAPCRNGGSCRVPAGDDRYVCDCPPGYTGRSCETDVDECAAAAGGACLHGGRCRDGVGDYLCDCSGTGYTGARCETNVNECEERGVCGHGACYDTYGGFVCACLPGYTGPRCKQMSACASGPCGVNGACVEENNGAGFRCVCARGTDPPLCEPPASTALPPVPPAPAPPSPVTAAAPSACADLVCPPRSHCRAGMPTMVGGVVMTKQVLCVCDFGYYGAPGPAPNCSAAEAACGAGVCLNGGACVRAGARLDCVCAPPYRGTYCELGPSGKALAERCSASPCVHALSCRDLPSGFACECEAGWTGARCDAAADDGAGAAAVAGGAQAEAGAGAGGGCRAGYGGPQCDLPLDCRAAACPPRQECVESGGGWRCAAAGADSACASSPCNNGSCVADDGLVRCLCPDGYTGRFCEYDKDECTLTPKKCNHGVCVNLPGSYQCYCKPGYTGEHCEQDIDECLSSPCKNGGICQNLENNYECTCMEGYEGKNCSVNINECAANPCAAGSTCEDGIASYKCLCQEGLTGQHCEIDIDDCESQPCEHGGRCVDGLNEYTCDCTGTGYSGDTCDVNVDECAPRPCRNGGTCIDDVNDYRCACHPGYTGRDCDADLDECASAPCLHGGVCLQRSDRSLYRARDLPPHLVGPQPHMLLPPFFQRPFAHENASGYECVCVAGTAGARCEVNVDECASSPCKHGVCVDGVGAYSCECAPGYEGAHCELDIDECARYRPCAHGRCLDARASYECACEAGWGGRNCSVALAGCAGHPCRHRGACLPWLRGETEHRFNCSCTPGHYGTTCEKITTMSLEKGSYAEVNTTREEGYDISFRFKTTLGNGLIAMGIGLTYFFLELSNGRLNLHSSLLNKWEGVFIGSNLNDSNWQKVFVTINSSHLVLAANEEQTIYPISQNEAYTTSVTSFPSTLLGTAGSNAPLTHGPDFFIGCIQDVVINGQWVLPEDSNSSMPIESTAIATAQEETNGTDEVGGAGSAVAAAGGEEEAEGVGATRTLLHGVLASCPRTPQCAPNPCLSGGVCEDHWTSFRCTCPRPYLGDTCQYNYTAATFGQEAARPRSVVSVAVSEAARRAVHAALDISMFIRTRKPTGQIFYLGSLPKYGQTEETLVGASLKGGELVVHLRFNQTPEDYAVGGTRLDNGYLHLIQVVRNSTLVQVKLNGTEYFRKSISAAKQLDAQVLYLGGPPPAPVPPTTPAPAADASSSPATSASATVAPSPATPSAPANPDPDDADYFKGVIQDVQVSNGVNVTVVQFFPLSGEGGGGGGGGTGTGGGGVRVPPPFGEVWLEPAGVLRGVVSDDACASRPCLHNATCVLTWNDYTCTCPRGYKGKQCAEVEFCQLQGCPLNSHCRNLDRGYECVSNATFDGVNTTLSYRLRVPRAATAAPDTPRTPDSLTITYKSKVGGTLFRAELEEAVFSVGLYKGQVGVQWRLGGLPALRRMRTLRPHHLWVTLRLVFLDGAVTGSFVEADGHEEVGLSEAIDVSAWQRLVTHGLITLGGVRAPTAATTTSATTAASSMFYTTTMVENSTDPTVIEYSEGDEFIDDNLAGEYFKGCLGAVHVGSLLLPFFTEEQLFVGSAAALLAAQPHYALVAGAPWGGAAGVGCVLCVEAQCVRGACRDVRTEYACACPAGYAGDYCQRDVDECAEHRCRNGARCVDGVAAYTCECARGYAGPLCETDLDECAPQPCAHGGLCRDLPGAFRCDCPPEWRGERCQEPRTRTCLHRPCAPGAALCRDVPDVTNGNNYTCECLEGYEGVHCELAFCEATPCVHGHCDTESVPAACACAVGWSGPLCEQPRDECAGAACLHGGRCLPARPPLCDCPPEWRGARCEEDVDECAEGGAQCGPGTCLNLPGGYTCLCADGLCGHGCALRDPCAGAPCLHGVCSPRCAASAAYVCDCAPGWAGANCTAPALAARAAPPTALWLGVGGALLALAAGGAALAALAAQARRKRATRGTYSPSGQEYCNPRAEMMAHALKPPPEERLI